MAITNYPEFPWTTQVHWQNVQLDPTTKSAIDSQIPVLVDQNKTNGVLDVVHEPDASIISNRYWNTEASAQEWIAFVTPLVGLLNASIVPPS